MKRICHAKQGEGPRNLSVRRTKCGFQGRRAKEGKKTGARGNPPAPITILRKGLTLTGSDPCRRGTGRDEPAADDPLVLPGRALRDGAAQAGLNLRCTSSDSYRPRVSSYSANVAANGSLVTRSRRTAL